MPTLSFNDFLNKYGSDTTTNIELLEWGKDLKIPNLKYVSKDELHTLSKSAKYILMNLQNHDQPGSHHVAIYNTPNYKFYFSSYGDPPPLEVDKFFGKQGIREYSDSQYQNFNEKYCGVISLFVLYKLFKGYKPVQILLELPKNC